MRRQRRARSFLWAYAVGTTLLILAEQYTLVGLIVIISLIIYARVELQGPRKMSRYQRLRKNGGRHTEAEWERLKRRYGYRCLACNEYFKELEKDHVIPVARGGTDHISNIQPLCRSCNASKGTKQIDYRRRGLMRWL